jgi:catechol 2,3-dioxygenase-like lactoylglutathione lyase family enzyme
MASKINHVAIMSGNYALESKFYESYFGMKNSAKARPHRAVSIGDGYVGMNINPRRAGRPARFDHYGIQVDDLEGTIEKLKSTGVTVLKRPDTRPFANYSTHDPDGNVFDLTEAGGENIKDVYAHNDWEQERTVSHVGLRTLNAEKTAQFYVENFDLTLSNGPVPDGAYGVTDGRMTLIILQWDLNDYAATGIVGPGLDYLGFKVESIDAFAKDVDEIAGNNPLIAPSPVGSGPEGAARLDMLRRTSIGSYHLADPDGILIDVIE